MGDLRGPSGRISKPHRRHHRVPPAQPGEYPRHRGQHAHHVTKRIAELGVTLTATDAAIDKLADKGFDPVYGARPLRRAIQTAIEDGTAEKKLTAS
jgi:hypothetical protein